MKTIPLSEAKAKLSKLVDRVASLDERVTITRNGPAVLVSPDEFESYQESSAIRADRELMKEIGRGLKALGRTRRSYTIEQLFEGIES